MIGAISKRLKDLGSMCKYSPSEREEIESLYLEVLDKKFVRTSCNDCYKDAVFEMYAYLKKNGKMKEKTLYRLKNGALLQMKFGSGEFYTNANLTDEAAERFLGINPEKVNLFSVVPDDWKVRAGIEEKKETKKKK